MDRMIWVAWRAFWVGLGASAVLIAQSLAAPAEPSPAPEPPRLEAPAPPVAKAPLATPATALAPVLERCVGSRVC